MQHTSNMDQLDRRILLELEKDGRLTNSELAARINLSPSACLRRVQELERSGIILGYHASLNPEAMGRGLTVFVSVELTRHQKSDQKAFERAIAIIPEVRECHGVSGAFAYLLRVEVADLAAYKYFHTEILATIPEVDKFESHFVMDSPKDLRA